MSGVFGALMQRGRHVGRARGGRVGAPRFRRVLVGTLLAIGAPLALHGQSAGVLQLDPQDAFGGALAPDRGAAGLRQRLLELGTTASVMQTTAHPDDEQSGLLTLLSRGTGARTALLTLTRGEAGDNAVGKELFDALGVLRTEELLLADHYYGVDDQYFTSAVDYGFSKTMREAARSWDTTEVLRDMVRIIRQNQPLVVISRWYGAARDGHGHHQLAGALTPAAVAAAADSTRFPEQLTRERLTTWRVRRLLRANVPPGERAEVVLDAGTYDPWLGESYQSLGADGLSRQRSQTAGRRAATSGAAPARLQYVAGEPVTAPDDLFAGIDTSLPGLFAAVGEPEPAGAVAHLRAAQDAADRALATFAPDSPWTAVPHLVAGLRAVRAAGAVATAGRTPRASRLLGVKERQFERALTAALALQVTAIAGPPDGDGAPVVPGQTVPVQLTVTQESPHGVTIERADVGAASTWARAAAPAGKAPLGRGAPWKASLELTVPDFAEPNRHPGFREYVTENRYRWRGDSVDYSPRGMESVRARVVLRVDGERFTVERTVRVRQGNEPDGATFPRLVVVPPVSMRVLPPMYVVTDTGDVRVPAKVELTANGAEPVDVAVELAAYEGPAIPPPQLVRVPAGGRRTVKIDVPFARNSSALLLGLVAHVDGREWREELTAVTQRGLEPAYLHSYTAIRIRRAEARITPNLEVGYVMGVGDQVPEAITKLGARVTLLDSAAVRSGDFSRFDALVIGTRAYAVRSELRAATPAILAYAKRGGNVVVLYQTPEFEPATMAPFPAALPDDAEETTEEDAPVEILDPRHALLDAPNRITAADFDGWIEQRGSKFLTNLAPQYTALVETHDTDQAPQRGVWVTARVGSGRWTYCALALHRQVPYGVPGAFRILANLLSHPAPR